MAHIHQESYSGAPGEDAALRSLGSFRVMHVLDHATLTDNSMLMKTDSTMPLTSILKRASSYLLGSEYEQKVTEDEHYTDNEMLFCKNNVCVHPPATARNDATTEVLHQPGYLTVTAKTFVDQYNNVRRPTLFLNWIPNSTLRKCPHELQNINSGEDGGGLMYSRQASSVDSLASTDGDVSVTSELLKSTNPFLNYDTAESISSAGTDDNVINIHVEISNPDIEITSSPSLSRSDSVMSCAENETSSPLTPGGGKSMPGVMPAAHRCRRFSVDLSQMRSLRLFFSDSGCTCGQLVVASRESQYKILHFHHGGLDHLAHVLHHWHSLLHSIKYGKGCGEDQSLPYRHFMVCRPEVADVELHPEEGQVTRLTEEVFYALFNERGQLEDDLALRKAVFFAGMERGLRKHVWPFLLHCYPYQSTLDERRQIAEIRRQEYEEITRRRSELSGTQLVNFKQRVQSVVEKDVVRTDRSNPYFAGDLNPHLDIMKNILLNYAVYNPVLGYTQGMSDLLAPVLCELGDEVAAFWCFVGLMQRAVFVATPTDRDMDVSLRYLRELVRLMLPHFHAHLERHPDARELLFCHRWILLCFKREFTEPVALRMWEACWANYLTDYFHLFLCLAIISVYADDVIAQDLRADEMLLHFSSLAMYMDGALIARKARGLLHQFRQLRELPCTVAGLCRRCGPGIWDSAHSPRIYCVHHDAQLPCPNTIW